MAVPTPESLAMNCEMKCDMCKESVNYGDDYRTHLQFAHSVTNNFPFFMNKALEKLKLETRKAADIVTLEEDVPDENEQSVINNEKVSEANVLDEKTKNQIEKTIEKTMDELFAPIRSLLEGKEPLEPLDDEINGDLGDDPYAYDDKVWQSFENLKDKVNNMEFPIELLQKLVSVSENDDELPSNPSKDTLEELVAPNPTVTKEEPVRKFRRPQTKRRAESPLVKDKESRKATPVTPSSTEVPASKSDLTPTQSPRPPVGGAKNFPPGKLTPVRSDRSDRSTNSIETGKLPTFFICPLESCSFYTSKQGMKGGKAANHFKEIHKMSGEDMKAAGPGAFKFKKVKGEPTA